MADCQSRSSQMNLAVASYELAARISAQAKLPKLESVAAVNEAAIQAKNGKVDEALELYQHALQLDGSTADNEASAADLLSYGRFLDDEGFPPKLAYACMVKSANAARSLSKPGPADGSSEIESQIEKKIEKRLGPEAAAIRRDPEPAVQQALTFRR